VVVVTSLETLLLLLGLGGTPPFLPLPEGKPWTARAVKLVPFLVPTYQLTTIPNLRLTQPLPLYVSTEKMISTASMCDRIDTSQKGDNAHSEMVYQAEQMQPF